MRNRWRMLSLFRSLCHRQEVSRISYEKDKTGRAGFLFSTGVLVGFSARISCEGDAREGSIFRAEFWRAKADLTARLGGKPNVAFRAELRGSAKASSWKRPSRFNSR